MHVYRVNDREWFPTRDAARADAEAAGEAIISEQTGCQAEDGSVEVMRIIVV